MNSLEKSKVQQIVHGLPYKPRNKEPSMFQILAWCSKEQQNNNQYGMNHQNTSKDSELHQQRKNNAENQRKNIIKTQQSKSPHQYKHQLYLYNDQKSKTNKIKNNLHKIQPPFQTNQQKQQKQKSLNPKNQQDLLEIQKRKNKIKNFKMLSRELPDSAFTTYFGKPAFSNYGSGSTSAQKKSFNVMPHAGKNHPQNPQSYEGALKKGKQININHLPKKPIDIYYPQNDNKLQSDYYEIPIKKPNLINSNRFAEDKSYLERKASTPRHNELNSLSSRQSFYKQNRLKTSHGSLNKKINKVKSLKTFQRVKNDYPLVENRQNLKQILDQKKRQQNKIAYKVTECYPLASQNCDKNCQIRCSRWSEMKPAGIKSPRSDHANDIFYQN